MRRRCRETERGSVSSRERATRVQLDHHNGPQLQQAMSVGTTKHGARHRATQHRNHTTTTPPPPHPAPQHRATTHNNTSMRRRRRTQSSRQPWRRTRPGRSCHQARTRLGCCRSPLPWSSWWRRVSVPSLRGVHTQLLRRRRQECGDTRQADRRAPFGVDSLGIIYRISNGLTSQPSALRAGATTPDPAFRAVRCPCRTPPPRCSARATRVSARG